MHFNDLPDEVKLLILSQFTQEEKLRNRTVSTDFARILDDKSFWKHTGAKSFSDLITRLPKVLPEYQSLVLEGLYKIDHAEFVTTLSNMPNDEKLAALQTLPSTKKLEQDLKNAGMPGYNPDTDFPEMLASLANRPYFLTSLCDDIINFSTFDNIRKSGQLLELQIVRNLLRYKLVNLDDIEISAISDLTTSLNEIKNTKKILSAFKEGTINIKHLIDIKSIANLELFLELPHANILLKEKLIPFDFIQTNPAAFKLLKTPYILDILRQAPFDFEKYNNYFRYENIDNLIDLLNDNKAKDLFIKGIISLDTPNFNFFLSHNLRLLKIDDIFSTLSSMKIDDSTFKYKSHRNDQLEELTNQPYAIQAIKQGLITLDDLFYTDNLSSLIELCYVPQCIPILSVIKPSDIENIHSITGLILLASMDGGLERLQNKSITLQELDGVYSPRDIAKLISKAPTPEPLPSLEKSPLFFKKKPTEKEKILTENILPKPTHKSGD